MISLMLTTTSEKERRLSNPPFECVPPCLWRWSDSSVPPCSTSTVDSANTFCASLRYLGNMLVEMHDVRFVSVPSSDWEYRRGKASGS